METWVDLLQSKGSLKKSSKRKTHSSKALKHSPVKQEVLLLDYSPVNNAPLCDGSEPNEVELLQKKLSQQQVVIAEVTHERERLLKHLELLRHQQRIVDNTSRLNAESHDLKESSLTELQLQGLRDALDQVTMEKSSILSQLTIQRDEMTSLTNQLAEQQQRMVTMTAAKDQMSTELYSCQQSLEECLAETEQLRSELHQKEEELERQMDRSVELSVNVDKLRQQVATLSDPIDDNNSLQSKLAELSAHNVEVEKQSLSYQQNNMLLEQQLTSLQQANDSLKLRNSTLEDSLIKAQLEMDSVNTRLATVDSSYQSDILKLQQKLVKAEECMHQLIEEKDNLTSKIQQEAAHCNTIQTEHSLLQAKHDQLVADKQLLEQELSMAQQNNAIDHNELLAQCKALRTELLQQTSSGVAMVTGLQQQLNESKQVYEKLASDYENCQRERDDVTSKLCSASVANDHLTLTNQKLLIQISDTEAELLKVKSDWMESCKKLNLAEHKIQSLSNNCAELDKQLVTMETSTIVLLNEQIQKLTEQLNQSTCYIEALEADNQALKSKLSELQNIVSVKRSESAELQEHLNEMTMKCDQLLSDLQGSNASHMIQQQEISDLRMQVTELEQQISSKLELTNEMNCLLVQRAHRIEELENMLASFNCNDASSFCNGGIDQMRQFCHKATQADLSSYHPALNSHSASSSQSHLDSTNSSHSGSGCSSPVYSISEPPSPIHGTSDISASPAHTTSGNPASSFHNARDVPTSPVHSASDIPASPVHSVRDMPRGTSAIFSDQLMATEMQCGELQQELTNQRVKFEQEILLLSQQFKRDMVSLENNKEREVYMLKNQISSLEQILKNQQTSLAGLVSNQIGNLASLRIEQSQVEEKNHLVKIVSDSQQELVKVTEAKITQLITEVELLRTRKAIMKECSEQLERTAISEHEKILLVKVDKLQNKVFVLRNQLKKKNSHCNYLRLRLGYVLAEVRLYKKLKADLDGQISILQNGFEQSSRQHLMCINLLEQAQHMSSNAPPDNITM